MRILVAFFVLVVFAESALAAPVPSPPDDYSSDQYVDGRGCVFNRDDHGWKNRVDSKGRHICGFPPSLSVRRTDPDTVSVLSGEAQPVRPDPEMDLTRQLASGLRRGEFVADKRAPEPLKELPVSDGGLGALIEEQIRLQNALQTAFAGDLGNTEICRSLGYHPSRDVRPIWGRDVTQGFCPGMIASEPGLKISYPASDANDAEEKNNPAGIVVASTSPNLPKPAERALPRPTRKPHHEVVRRKRIKPASTTGAPVELIPATARYVEVGTYAVTNAAATAKQRIARLGYPVGSGQQVTEKGIYNQVFAGPFDDRRSLVVALKLLREKGFPSAYAR